MKTVKNKTRLGIFARFMHRPTLMNIVSCQELMNSKTLSKPKSFHGKKAAKSYRWHTARNECDEKYGKNKSPNFHNLSRAPASELWENRLRYFQEKKTVWISMLRKLAPTLSRALWGVNDEGEHVIKTFTHGGKISLICFHSTRAQRGILAWAYLLFHPLLLMFHGRWLWHDF